MCFGLNPALYPLLEVGEVGSPLCSTWRGLVTRGSSLLWEPLQGPKVSAFGAEWLPPVLL